MFSVCGRDEEDALAAPLRGAAFGGMVLWCDVVDGVVVPVFGGLKKKIITASVRLRNDSVDYPVRLVKRRL